MTTVKKITANQTVLMFCITCIRNYRMIGRKRSLRDLDRRCRLGLALIQINRLSKDLHQIKPREKRLEETRDFQKLKNFQKKLLKRSAIIHYSQKERQMGLFLQRHKPLVQSISKRKSKIQNSNNSPHTMNCMKKKIISKINPKT